MTPKKEPKPSNKLLKLEKLLDVFETGSVQPEELIQAVEAVMAIIKQTQEDLTSKITDTDSTINDKLVKLAQVVDDANDTLQQIIEERDSLSKQEMTEVRTLIAKELARVESLIPELPEEFDASDIYNMMEEHKVMLRSLSELVIGENIRNALEVLPEGEKLSIEAIEGLQAELDKRQESLKNNVTALIARNLYQIGDVSVAGATDGQVLAYNATTGLWEATTVAGTGDMTAAVYDPNSVASDAFTMTNMNGGNWKVFYTNGSGDVIELALGANNTYLKSNGASSAPTFETPTATVAALDDVGDVTITTIASGEVLKWNGTAWINNTLAEAGIAAASHTHTASEVTDFDTEVSNNTDVAANTSARHDAVTVLDSAEIDFTLTGQQITASLVAGSIDETKLDTSVNASLDLADSASQPGHTHTESDITDLKNYEIKAVANGSLTAALDTYYVCVSNSTFTDPSPVEGEGFAVFVRNGTATVGGTGYSTAGTIIHRIYHSGAWANYVYQVSGTFQPLDAELTAIAGLTSAADRGIYFTGSGTASLFTLTSAARSILDDASTTAIRTTLGVGTGDSPQFTAVNIGNASDTTVSRVSAGVIAVEGVTVPTISSTNTLTNKRVTKRVGSTTSSATPTINTDLYDAYHLTAQAVDITSFTTNLSGTPTDFQQLRISVTGTAARSLTFGSSFSNGAVALPTTTVSTDRLDMLFEYSTITSKWRCMASASQA